ncbi:MAG TPA: dihydroneopterin aldolase [Trueperaceae bacterium]|nr:dihydroneopterin aldolase [Trueperaceae bacterium]
MAAERGKIVLSGMEFHAYHGVHDYELAKGARFVVDVELEVDVPAVDTLSATVDYSRVYRLVRREVLEVRHKLIESLADSLASALLSEEPEVMAVLVRVHKPHAPLPGIVRDVAFELRRERA